MQAGITPQIHSFFIEGTRSEEAQEGALLPAHRILLKLTARADIARHAAHGTLHVTVPMN